MSAMPVDAPPHRDVWLYMSKRAIILTSTHSTPTLPVLDTLGHLEPNQRWRSLCFAVEIAMCVRAALRRTTSEASGFGPSRVSYPGCPQQLHCAKMNHALT
eukprot:2779866-Rhodomonas_salina.1